jgi:hypothetical protein
MNHVHATEQKAKNIQAVTEEAAEGMRNRVEHVRDIVESVRDTAEVAFRDRPYLVPVAAGAVGLGIGLLLGSKLTRFMLCAAVGTLLTDTLGGEIKRMAGDFLSDFQKRLAEGEPEATAPVGQ